MVGRLVDEKEIVFLEEQRREQRFGALPVAQGRKRAIQRSLVHAKQVDLADELPGRVARTDLIEYFHGVPPRVGYVEREVIEVYGSGNAPLIFVFAHEQVEERGLAAPVPAGEAEFPVRVELEGHVFEYVVVAALVAERQIVDGYQRHNKRPPWDAGMRATETTNAGAASAEPQSRRNNHRLVAHSCSSFGRSFVYDILSLSRRQL